MKFKDIMQTMRKTEIADEFVVESLYKISTKSFIANIVLATLITMALYPVLKIKILLWFALVVLFVLYRIYNTHKYYKDASKFSKEIWLRKFRLQALITASIYAYLGIFYIFHVDVYYQLFIITMLLGLSSASAFALSQDIRLSIAYALILLVPLIVILFFIDMPLHIILTISLIMYLMTQITTIHTIYKQRQTIDNLEAQNSFLDTFFLNAPLGVFTYDENLEVTGCNEGLNKLFDHKKGSLLGQSLEVFPDPRVLCIYKQALSEGAGSYAGPHVSLQGETFWIEAKAFKFSKNSEAMCIIEDKTKEHAALEELEQISQHDSLAGLPNRRGLGNYIDNLVRDEKHNEYYSLLFYLDLNQFKSINDSLGHAIGDEILIAVSERLLNVIYSDDRIVSRVGGDEFIIIIPFVSKYHLSTKEEAEKYSNIIDNTFTEPFIVEDIPLQVNASIGVLFVEPNDMNTKEMLRLADLTMYQAKHKKIPIAYYDSSLDKKHQDLFMLQQSLASATENKEFKLFFQPIVKMKNQQIHAAELLIRWVHPTKGMLTPEVFIPLALKTGLLSKITWWLIDSVCKQIETWKANNVWNLEYISINIDPKQLLEKNFATELHENLKKYNVNTDEIMLEITEQSLIDNFTNTQGVVNDLKALGIKCAIDDFGIGYSSLSYLKKLSFDTLKIDKTFVQDIGKNPKELILINTILDIGRLFGYNIIIEGIENDVQKKALLELDKELSFQGFIYSEPIPIDEFTQKFLQKD